MGVSSRSVVGSGGELCGLCIIGMGDADVRVGSVVEDNGCGCTASLGGLVIGVALAPPRGISSLSIVFGIFLTCFFLSGVIRWSDVDACDSVAGWSVGATLVTPRVVLTNWDFWRLTRLPAISRPVASEPCQSYQVHFQASLCQ